MIEAPVDAQVDIYRFGRSTERRRPSPFACSTRTTVTVGDVKFDW